MRGVLCLTLAVNQKQLVILVVRNHLVEAGKNLRERERNESRKAIK